MATYSDSFTNTAGTALASHATWDLYRGSISDLLRIATGGLTLTTKTGGEDSTTHIFNYAGLSSTAADSVARAKIVSFQASDYLRFILALRIGNAGNPNYYAAEFHRTAAGNYSYRIQKRVSGTTSDLIALTGTSSWAEGDTVEFRAVGTALSIYVNGSLLNSTTDASLSTGYVGIGAYRATGASTNHFVIDDFYGDDAYVAGGSVAPIVAYYQSMQD